MKKSQLRKIIRESIKEMMTEQDRGKTNNTNPDGKSGLSLTPPPRSIQEPIKEQQLSPCPSNSAYMTLEACPNSYHWTGNYIAGPWHAFCANINGNLPTQADVGTTVDMGPQNPNNGPNSYTILSVSPGQPTYHGSMTMNATSACCVPAVQCMQGGCITPPSGCDPSAWPNHSNWINTWTSLPNFSSSNPNQPCNMICNKLQIWNNNLSGAGPVQTNQLNCKIEEAQNQSGIHGCNC